MRVFENFNSSHNHVCLVCKKGHDAKTVLVCIDGTLNEGLEQAKQIHLDCITGLEFRFKTIEDQPFIYARLP